MTKDNVDVPDLYDLDGFILVEYDMRCTYNLDTIDGITENNSFVITTGTLMVWPSRFIDGMGSSNSYRINNDIDNNGNYFCITSYAPKGRPFWTEFLIKTDN